MSIFDAVICSGCQKCFPVHKTNAFRERERRCVACAPLEINEDPVIFCSTPETPPWVAALGVVHFDLLVGQVLEVLYPPLPLSQTQETEVSFLCFPDANHVADGDNIHDFVFAYNLSECDVSRATTRRNNKQELTTTSSSVAGSNVDSGSNCKMGFDSTSTDMFCSTLFRQRKDSSIQRGAQQKALLVMSNYPFPSVTHQILRILCAATFDVPGADYAVVLESAFKEILTWPAPLPTNTFQLSLLGRALTPYTTPIYSAAEVEHLRWSETKVNSGRADEARRRLINALTSMDASLHQPAVKDALTAYLASAGCPPEMKESIELKLAAEKTDKDDRAALLDVLRILLVAPLSQRSVSEEDGSEKEAAAVVHKDPHADDETLDRLLQHFRCHVKSLLRSDVAEVQNEALEALQKRAHTILASPQLSKAPCRAAGAGRGKYFFSEMEFHHAMYPHLPKLWKLWELMIVGAPIAVLSYDAPTVTTTCLTLASLTAPLRFAGVLRPYVTINNREVDLFVKETAPPSVLFGTTNPFFVRRCIKWPYFLCLSKESDEPHTHKMLAADSDKREKQQFKLKNRMFSSRHFLIKTEKSIQELYGSGGSSSPPVGKMSFVDLNPQSSEGTSMRNLRQQFLELTEEFLSPLKAVIRKTLREERPFFIPAESERLLAPDALLQALSAYTGPTPLSSFKNRADMLAVFKEFLNTNAFRLWCQDQSDFVFRELILSVPSLEELLLMDPDPSTRHLVLQSLQDEFDRIISRPIVDLELAQKLSALCSRLPMLRRKIACVL